MTLWLADVYADRTDSDFDRYCVRSESAQSVRRTLGSLLVKSAKIEVEEAPAQAKSIMEGVPDDMPVLVGDGNTYFMRS